MATAFDVLTSLIDQFDDINITDSINVDPKVFNLKCNGSISECDHFENFLIFINEYHINQNINDIHLERIDIDSVINSHIHLIHEHENDDDFEYIHNKMNTNNCNIFQCDIFMRNHRNRNKTNLSELFHSNDVHVIVLKQILDKIHCHYAHSFDIGHRLRINEKINEKNMNLLIHLLKNKHKKYTEIHQQLDKTMQSKFVTMPVINEYCFGIEFFYDGWWTNVKNKYNCLKEELLHNQTMTILTEQFNSELYKAKKYFNARYCQKVLINEIQKNNEFDSYIEITFEHILSVLVYCNYSWLQNAFTKTYRANHRNESKESIWKRHEEFFFLGKYLKQSVERIGQRVSDGKVKHFYHGIGERLLFSLQRINKIFSPLSTSSSKAVAINFAANGQTLTQGMLVEFSDQDGCPYNFHFCVEWCSDFTNEREHLFVQSALGLKFVNIIDLNTGYEFDIILEAMNLLNSLLNFNEEYNAYKAQIAVKLIKHETKMQEWSSLNIYAEKLFHEYCSQMIHLDFNWKEVEKYSKIYQIYKSEKYNAINIAFLNVLYPNLEDLEVVHTNIYSLFLDDIWSHLQQSGTILEIRIRTSGENEGMSTNDAVERYAKKFNQIGFCIEIGDRNSISIWSYSLLTEDEKSE